MLHQAMAHSHVKAGAHRPSLEEWLLWIESFPLVPRWQWHPTAMRRWLHGLTNAHLPACVDAAGNVLLGAATESAWYARLRTEALCLHAHLDHPGAVVLTDLGTTGTRHRYMAVVQGGWSRKLSGAHMDCYAQDGTYCTSVLIDHVVEGLRETWLSFTSEHVLTPPAYLLPPQTNRDMTDAAMLEGWGLDDHVGCAAVLEAMGGSDNTPLGVLTHNEEIGGYGLYHLIQQGEAQGITIAEWPLLLSLEVTPEYATLPFRCGDGARWRSADAHTPLDAEFLTWVRTTAPHEAVALASGNCEAGLWTQHGGRAACLVIPCQFAHNGYREREWRAERVHITDVHRMAAQLRVALQTWPNTRRRSRRAAEQRRPLQIKMQDHVAPLRPLAAAHPEYLGCLQHVLPAWNALHTQFQLPLIKISHQEWPAWRTRLMEPTPWHTTVAAIAPACFRATQDWLDLQPHAEEVKLHLFAGAPFNACTLADGLAFSIEKLRSEDLRRLLIHESVHWLIAPWLRQCALRPLASTAIHEGLACYATMELLGISKEEACQLPHTTWQHYAAHGNHIADMALDWWHGRLLETTSGRHLVVTRRHPPHPFTVNGGGSWTKYGYVLGLRYIEEVLAQLPGSWRERIQTLTDSMFEHFLAEIPVQRALLCVVPHSEQRCVP